MYTGSHRTEVCIPFRTPMLNLILTNLTGIETLSSRVSVYIKLTLSICPLTITSQTSPTHTTYTSPLSLSHLHARVYTHQRLQGRADMPPSAKGEAGDGWFGGGGGGDRELGQAPPWISAAFSCHSVHGHGEGGGARRGLEGGGAGYRGKPGPRPCPLLPAYDGENPTLRPGVWASASHACNTGVNHGAQRGETTLSPLEDYRLMSAEFVRISIAYTIIALAHALIAHTHARARTALFLPELARHHDVHRLHASQIPLLAAGEEKTRWWMRGWGGEGGGGRFR